MQKAWQAPLHPIRMSMPMICPQDTRAHQCQDVLMHLLYSGSCEALLRSLIAQSMQNIAAEHPASPGVRRALAPFAPSPSTPHATLRAVFFLLLNQDGRMRDALCTKRVAPYLPELCPHKACRFYDSLKESVIVDWVKDEGVHLLEFVERIKEAYLVS